MERDASREEKGNACARREGGWEREENGQREREGETETEGEGFVKSIRDTLVKVYILVRHEHKAIRTAVVFNLWPSPHTETCQNVKIVLENVPENFSVTQNYRTFDQ